MASLGVAALLIGATSGVGNWLNQVGNDYVETITTPTWSSSKKDDSSNNFQKNISQSIAKVDYVEVAKSALIGMIVAPLSYVSNTVVTSAFSGLEKSVTNTLAEVLVTGLFEINISGVQFVIDLF